MTVRMIANAGQFLKGQVYTVNERRARHLITTGYARIETAPQPPITPSAPASSHTPRHSRREGRR